MAVFVVPSPIVWCVPEETSPHCLHRYKDYAKIQRSPSYTCTCKLWVPCRNNIYYFHLNTSKYNKKTCVYKKATLSSNYSFKISLEKIRDEMKKFKTILQWAYFIFDIHTSNDYGRSYTEYACFEGNKSNNNSVIIFLYMAKINYFFLANLVPF